MLSRLATRAGTQSFKAQQPPKPTAPGNAGRKYQTSGLKAGKGKDGFEAHIRKPTQRDLNARNLIKYRTVTENKTNTIKFQNFDLGALKLLPEKVMDKSGKSEFQPAELTPGENEKFQRGLAEIRDNAIQNQLVKKWKLDPQKQTVIKLADGIYSRSELSGALSTKEGHRLQLEIGQIIKARGYTADDQLPFCNRSYYSSMIEMVIANTNGITVEDWENCKTFAPEFIANIQKDYPDCPIVTAIGMNVVKMEPDHPTLGNLPRKIIDEKGTLEGTDQAAHVVRHLGVMKNGEFIKLMTMEATGISNHVPGIDSEEFSVSHAPGHRSVPTHMAETRGATKSGDIRTFDLTPKDDQLAGDNASGLYVVPGDQPQRPKGMYNDKYIDIVEPLCQPGQDPSQKAIDTAASFLLLYKGGHILTADDLVPNPDSRHNKVLPEYRPVLSFSGVGQHGQHGELINCVNSGLDYMFMTEKLAELNQPGAQTSPARSVATTGDAMRLLIDEGKRRGMTFIDYNGKAYGPDKYDELDSAKDEDGFGLKTFQALEDMYLGARYGTKQINFDRTPFGAPGVMSPEMHQQILSDWAVETLRSYPDKTGEAPPAQLTDVDLSKYGDSL